MLAPPFLTVNLGTDCLVSRLDGLVVKARAADPGPISLFRRRSLSRSSHISHLNIGTPVTALSGAWRYVIGAGTGWARCQYTVTGGR